MTQRKMSVKFFLKKIVSAKSAEGFLSQYREYLLTGELLDITTPVVAKLDRGELLPTPAMEELATVVLEHIKAQALASLAASQSNAPSTSGSEKPVIALILNGKGEEVESKSFDLGQVAQRWTDRHLIEQSTDCIGKVIHRKVMIKGQPMEETITREDAYLRLNPRKKSPFMKRSPQSVSSLKSRMKAAQSRANFSHG